MATGAEESMEQSSSTTIGNMSQRQQAEPLEAVVGDQCPWALSSMLPMCPLVCTPATAASRCGHTSTMCPLCRQPLDHILHSVRGDGSYQNHVFGSSSHSQRKIANERVWSRYPHCHYTLHPWPRNNFLANRRRGLWRID